MLLHSFTRSPLLTGRIRHRLKHLHGEDDKDAARSRLTFLILFSCRSCPYIENANGHIATFLSPHQIMQNMCRGFTLPILSAFGRRQRSCTSAFPGFLKPDITFPGLWGSWTEDEVQVKLSRQARWASPVEWQGENTTGFTDPSCLLFQTRAPSFAFLWKVSWAAPGSARSARGEAQRFSTGHPLSLRLLAARGERQGPNSSGGGGRNTYSQQRRAANSPNS